MAYRNGQLLDEPYVVHTSTSDDSPSIMEWQRGNPSEPWFACRGCPILTVDTDPSTYAPSRDTWGPLVVPEDQYFMLGDNREHSLDSRYWGLLEGWRLEGRAVFTYFSYNKDSYRPFPALREIRWGRIGSMID